MEVEFEATIQHPKYGECEVTVVATMEPIVRGRYNGPPEDCYPDEGGEIEYESITIALCNELDEPETHKGETVDFEDLSKDDRDKLDEQVAEAAMAAEEAAYEDWCDRQADR